MTRNQTFGYPILCAILTCSIPLASAQQTGARQNNQQGDQNQNQQSDQQNAWIEQLSKTVELTSDQKSQIRSAVQEHDQKLTSTWGQFNQAHLQAISLEASLYAALQDNMNDQQKQQFQQARQQQENENRMAMNRNDSRPDQSRRDSENQRTETSDRDQQRDSRSGQQSGVADSGRTGSQRSGTGNERTNQQDQDDMDQSTDSGEYYVSTMIIVPAKQCYSGMDEECKKKCDENCSKYKSELTSAWRTIHQTHNELVKLEAEKIQAIEDVLKPEQLEKLKNSRSGDNDNGSSKSSG